MGSRIGSIAILLVIGAIVAAVVLVITRLDLLDTGQPDAPIMVVSLDDGELVLIDQAQSITVTISSGNPITTLELFVDKVSVVSILPAYSADRGAWIGSFVWTPDSLGFADISIAALDDQGVESVRHIRVEVTDDQARVAAAIRVDVVGIVPLQQLVAGAAVLVQIRVRSNQPIERIDFLNDDVFVIAVTPGSNADGEYNAEISWTPNQTGEVDATFSAVDITGQSESRTVPVVILREGQSLPESGSAGAQESSPEREPEASSPTQTAGVGQARIESPSDGQRFTLDSNFELSARLTATNVGAIASVLLYLTPIGPDNTLGDSILIHSSESHPAASYEEMVEEVERWITRSGSYEFQLVVFTPEKDRYDDRIVIHVVAAAGTNDQPPDEEDTETETDEEDRPTSDDIDLAIVTVRQAADDPRRLNVTITNASSIDIERTSVLITVVDKVNSSELASAEVSLGIDADDLSTIPVDLEIAPGANVEATVFLESIVDTNPTNNTFDVLLTAPEATEATETQPEDVSDPTEAQEEQEQQEQPQQQEPEAEQESLPQTGPDLTFLDSQSTSDGYVLLTVINNGDGPARTFSIVIEDANGVEAEVISRRDAGAQPLTPGQTEILTSLQAHSGSVTVSIVLGGHSVDLNPADNQITLELP